jgi:hypothetical protein
VAVVFIHGTGEEKVVDGFVGIFAHWVNQSVSTLDDENILVKRGMPSV